MNLYPVNHQESFLANMFLFNVHASDSYTCTKCRTSENTVSKKARLPFLLRLILSGRKA